MPSARAASRHQQPGQHLDAPTPLGFQHQAFTRLGALSRQVGQHKHVGHPDLKTRPSARLLQRAAKLAQGLGIGFEFVENVVVDVNKYWR